ncbi:hypothetical protein D3C80_2209900 [compost metagenome]
MLWSEEGANALEQAGPGRRKSGISTGYLPHEIEGERVLIELGNPLISEVFQDMIHIELRISLTKKLVGFPA